MVSGNRTNESYYDLAEHSATQVFIFTLSVIIFVSSVFYTMLPTTEIVLTRFLSGQVKNDGKSHEQYLDMKEPLIKTNYFFRWSVDLYLKTAQEARYWFNPTVSFSLISLIIGLMIAVFISTLMPPGSGYMRHKIEREIAGILNKIALAKYGIESRRESKEVAKEIKLSEIRTIVDYIEDINMTLDDIRILKKALIWREESLIYRLFHINDGLTMYMRFYFTVKYSNAVLGFVYIGAAVLIIIIGLRGLKFIPPTEPSLILFALGLEFSLLILYAITLMYTKHDEDSEFDTAKSNETMNMSSDFGSAREIERLLRIFIKSRDNK